MKSILQYIREYFYETDKRVLTAVTLFTAVLVFINYGYGIDTAIRKISSWPVKLLSWYAVFLLAFGIPYLLYGLLQKRNYFRHPAFTSLLFIAPVLFAFKISTHLSVHFSDNSNWNYYWNQVVHWPALVIMILGMLWATWRIHDKDQPFYGIRTKGIDWKPYIIMLLIMVPLVAAASTQADFLDMYPKIQLIRGVYREENMNWWHQLIFELAYGSDFITIEFFFRGFLVLAFMKWAGKDAILAMACFYCTIHFGKPLGECISSYFGGLLLGIVVYHTRSIFGGLMVHLGIAWMMELGGYIGASLSK